MKTQRTPGKYERLCWERHARDLADPRGKIWRPEAGERVITFIEKFCKHHKGEWAGHPLILEPWQREALKISFGWFNADGTRRFRTVYIEVPRKNGKSELAGGVGLYLLIGDQEPGAEIYSSATKKDQAKIVWKVADAMVAASPQLKRWVKRYKNSLHVERTDSNFEPLAADSNTLDGLNPHGNIVDELHAHKDRGVWDVLDTAMGARRQPVTLAITTAGTYEPESIGWQMHEYATQVLDQLVEDDTFFAFIAHADEGDDYFSEETQRKANPNFGVSVKPEYLKKQAAMAQKQPSFMNTYLRLHLNVWTQQLTRWLSIEQWNACDPTPADVDPRAWAVAREAGLRGMKCWGGLDLASKLDLASFVAIFPQENNVIDLVARFWLPEATIAAYSRKRQKHFETWADLGWITKTPGDVIDYDFIRRDISAFAKDHALQELAYDPWGATDLATKLGEADGIQMVETRQGFKTLSEPSKDLEARIVAKQVRHAGNPVMRFCVANAVVTEDPAGNIKPDKAKASGKIDGVVATVMALSRLIVAPASTSPYETRGIRTL